MQVERSIRWGEIFMMVGMVVGMIAGWFAFQQRMESSSLALQTQVQANTQTINKNLRLIEALQEDVGEVRDYQIRHDAYQAGLEAGATRGEKK